MFSVVRRALAWVVLATFAATFGLGAAVPGHAAGDDDAACDPGSVAGHATSQFELVKLPVASAHCPFCHWQRVVGGGSLVAADAAAIELQPADRVPPRTPEFVPSVSLTGTPSRGPPAENV